MSKGYCYDGDAEDGWIVFVHDYHTPIMVRESDNIIGLMSRYKINQRGQKERSRLLLILNELNKHSKISNYTLYVNHDYKPDQIEIKTHWLSFYNEDMFNMYLKMWQYDIRDRILNTDDIEDYLLLTRKSVITA